MFEKIVLHFIKVNFFSFVFLMSFRYVCMYYYCCCCCCCHCYFLYSRLPNFLQISYNPYNNCDNCMWPLASLLFFPFFLFLFFLPSGHLIGDGSLWRISRVPPEIRSKCDTYLQKLEELASSALLQATRYHNILLHLLCAWQHSRFTSN